MKDQKTLYNTLQTTEKIFDRNNIDKMISELSGNICTIRDVAEQGINNPSFATTALLVISQFAGLIDEQVNDVDSTLLNVRRHINNGLSEPEPQYVEEEEY